MSTGAVGTRPEVVCVTPTDFDPASCVSEGRCPVCAESVSGPSNPIIGCPRCATPHHRACWVYNTGCSIYGCSAQAPAPRRPLDLSAPYEEPKPARDIPGLALRAATPFGYRPPRRRFFGSPGIALALFIGIIVGGYSGGSSTAPGKGHTGKNCAFPVLEAHEAHESLTTLHGKLEGRCKCVKKRLEALGTPAGNAEVIFLTKDMSDPCACVRNWAAIRLAAQIPGPAARARIPGKMSFLRLHRDTLRLVEHRLFD